MKIRQRNTGSVVCLDLEGRMVLTDGDDAVRDKVNSLLYQGHLRFVINLKEVSQMDTSGLTTMMSIRLAVHKRGGDIRLCALTARIHNLLVITRLITLFEVFDSEAEAVNSFPVETSVL